MRKTPPAADDPKVSQAEPTAPHPIDANGRVLDNCGLPINGPARARALATLNKPDPRDEPDAWPAPDGSAALISTDPAPNGDGQQQD